MRMTIAIVLLGVLVVRGERDETANVRPPVRVSAPVPMPVLVPTPSAHPRELGYLAGNAWTGCGCQAPCGCCGAATLCYR
jgi:hypothetical protein